MRAKPIKALELIYPMIRLFIKNISPFMIDYNLPANSSVLTVAEHIWKMWAIYHRFDGITSNRRGSLAVYSLAN